MKKSILKRVFAIVCALAMVVTTLISTPITANAATLSAEQVAINTAYREKINACLQQESEVGYFDYTFSIVDLGIYGKNVVLTRTNPANGNRETRILFNLDNYFAGSYIGYDATKGYLTKVLSFDNGKVYQMYTSKTVEDANLGVGELIFYYAEEGKYTEIGAVEITDPERIAAYDTYYKNMTIIKGEYSLTEENLNKYLPIVQTTKKVTAVCYGEKDGNGNAVPLTGAKVSIGLCNDKSGSHKVIAAATAIGTNECDVYYNGDKFVYIDEAGVATEYTYLVVYHSAPADSIYQATNVPTWYTVADLANETNVLEIKVKKGPLEVVRAETEDYFVLAYYLNGGEEYRDTFVSYRYEEIYSDAILLEALSKLTADDTVVGVSINGMTGELPTPSDTAMEKMANLGASLYMYIEETGEEYFCEKVEYTKPEEPTVKPEEPTVKPLFPTGEYTLEPITLNVGGAFALKQSDLDKLISSEVVEMNAGSEKIYFGEAINVDGDCIAQTLKYRFYATDLQTVVHEGHWTAEESQAFFETGVDGKWYYEGQEVIPVEEGEGIAFFVMRADKAGTTTVTIPEYKIGNTTIKLTIPFVVKETSGAVPPTVEPPAEPEEVTKEEIEKAKDHVLNVVNGSASAERKKTEIATTLETEVVAAAMQKDPEFKTVISSLEESYKQEQNVTVENATVEKAVEKVVKADSISVVGAGLNGGTNSKVRLDVAKVTKEVSVAPNYTNAVQVDIKLLVNETSKSILDIPVSITMDIPAGVDTKNLVILHYHGDATTPSLIRPEVNGTKITFAVDRFSTFVFANEEATATGGGIGTYYYMNPYAPSSSVLSPKTGDTGYVTYVVLMVAMFAVATAGVVVVRRKAAR